jgi:phenylpropionate dioxygenase-like ring-hydroxylating dioxygenase large terminal subunit
MCLYHAWQYNGNSKIEVIPQAVTSKLDCIKKNPKSSCNSFPTNVKNGLLWVWQSSGSDARILSKLTPIVDMSLEGFFDELMKAVLLWDPGISVLYLTDLTTSLKMRLIPHSELLG